MSDEEVSTKRGRKGASETTKRASKKDDGDAPVAKRGRGRPKGSKKKADKPKTNGTTGRRGRSKKEEKAKESSAEENGKSSADEEEED